MGSNVYLSDKNKELIVILIDYYLNSGSSLDIDKELQDALENLDTKISNSKIKK